MSGVVRHSDYMRHFHLLSLFGTRRCLPSNQINTGTMARLTILLVALVAAMANAFVPVPLSRTGELNFLVVEVLESRFFGVEKEQWRRRRRIS